MLRRSFRSYRAGSLQHVHVPLHMAPVQMRGVGDLIEHQGVVHVMRLRQGSKNLEDNNGFRLRHARLRFGLSQCNGARHSVNAD